MGKNEVRKDVRASRIVWGRWDGRPSVVKKKYYLKNNVFALWNNVMERKHWNTKHVFKTLHNNRIYIIKLHLDMKKPTFKR